MAKAPLVSIIIPVYNAEKYIGSCLDCVCTQNYRRLEIIVIDDGSTDGSAEIIHSYMEGDPRIIYKRVENGGPSRARNIGLDMATGMYVSFIDADDLCAAEMIQTLVSQVAPSDVCVCKKVRWNQKTNSTRVDGWDEFSGSIEEFKTRLFAYQRSMRSCTSRMYRLDVIREHNVRFREGLHYGEDMYFNYEFFKHAVDVTFIDAPLYTYRIDNNDSLSSRNHTFFLKQWKNQRECIRDAFGD